MIRAVATDVDGTITDDNSIIDIEAIEAIRKLEGSGIKVILCSGNALCILKALARYIGCSGPTVAENGGVVEYRGKIKILGERGLGRRAIDHLRSVYGDLIREAWSNPHRYVDAAIMRTIDYDKVASEVNKFEGIKVIDSGFAYHILDKRVDKGVGLLEALRWAGLSREEVAGVGDSMTDAELLRAAGIKCVVANGDESIKKEADYVSTSKFGKGFAEIAEAILSGKIGSI
uniref:Phosphoglycolate phosphatase n=1 Tax=Candidatus Methanosuratincola petrocarbonis (ex Vanwonterghem et al. 2016) TaxID=1867261 RepID=A0A7J3V1W5_9CREN